eukprot:CAMPEP_0195518772 /NCGR_PEP_ID=MMETSP0794_2-20130614/13624_1 /TAXON_ID=515487 /ORGANISM="Stephanopyxis turris, Strain CCMP 815" /LENGTH=562 /DNA_ID=CAMNT_0040647793 /DNA_START=234 /DNA_END=1922 /DNA_ORIENTATION=-
MSSNFLGRSSMALLPKKGKKAPQSRRIADGGLTMHMGHSHSHHIHEHDNKVQGDETEKAKNWLEFLIRLPRRRVARVLFAGLAILGPALLRHRKIRNADLAVFCMTSTVLSLFDAGRREFWNGMSKMKELRDGVMKHSSPVSYRKFIKYFFKNDNAADQVTLLGGVVNILLSIGKFIIGISCNSSALVADAGHSLSDLFSDFITLWAVQVGRIPPDDDHPYGHGKFEAVGSLFLSLTLLGTGLSVGAMSSVKLNEIIAIQRSVGLAAGGAAMAGQIPTPPALIMAGLSILSKEWIFRVTRRVGEDLKSQIVLANAWHHRSDAYSSVLALVSIGLAIVFPSLLAADSFAGLLVAGMICMTGAEIMIESIKQLTDTNNEELVGKVEKVIAHMNDDIVGVKRIRARQVGSTALVDVSITTADGLSSSAVHTIEERLRRRIMEDEPSVIDAEVHATSPAVVCPLLVSTSAGNEKSASEVEDKARSVLLKFPDVQSVEGITVHYEDTLLANVDVDIRIDPGTTVAKANSLAGELRESLEKSNTINKACVFLDLNEENTNLVTRGTIL